MKPNLLAHYLLASFLLSAPCSLGQAAGPSLGGVLRDEAGRMLPGTLVELREVPSKRVFASLTGPGGAFRTPELPPGSYSISVRWHGQTVTASETLAVRERERLSVVLELSVAQGRLTLHRTFDAAARPVEEPGPNAQIRAPSSGGEQLSSQEVAELPLNKRDFSQLLLLAAGTMTDTNGAANFTQQFAVNGQRGTTTVFAMDGVDTTDPEMGGATFSNFNVDAIQEIQSRSSVMPAEIGHGAAGFTNVVTKSGSNQIHGSAFEFTRNAAFDARNFFDRRSPANPGRIPPFARNEFGFTSGGPVVLPGLYNGRNRTFYFGQYQGFRQVLGTTQVLSVPTLAERQGLDTTAFPGDTLIVPVDPRIAQVLARYPVPNDPQGAFGARTYATSSKVSTFTNQFSVRIDHRASDKATIFTRFSLNQASGPLINPNQTAIDPTFAIRFLDHQRNVGLTYARALSPRLSSESSFGFIRSTPLFPTINQVQPALVFGDALYEPFNTAGGSVLGAFGNLFQARHNLAYIHGNHSFRMGVEARFNRDTGLFGINPNGLYLFGGGPAYARMPILSSSGLRDIRVGDPLPDTLTGFLTATPHAYTISVAPSLFAQGDRLGESAIRREAYNFYFQEAWRVRTSLTVNYGLRYEANSRFREAKHRASEPIFVDAAGSPVHFWDPSARQRFLLYPQPPFQMDWRGWGPRLSGKWRITDHTTFDAGGAIITILPNLWQDNFLTGGFPFTIIPFVAASSGAPVPFANAVTRFELPPILTPAGQPVFATGRSTDVPPNTEMDLLRFEQDLAALTPGRQVQLVSAFGMFKDFRNGYIGSYTAGLEHELQDVKVSVSYVATVGVKLVGIISPNGYGGAAPGFAPFTRFDAAGHVLGGYGPESFISNRSHSTYHSLQAAIGKTSVRAGLGFQASYTFSKSLDDTSAVLGGYLGSSSGTLLQASPQDPRNPGAEKGPSTFDITHVFTLSLIQMLPFERLAFLERIGRKFTTGWQIVSVSTLTSGPPFTIFSGVQQTGAGMNAADRPDQIGRPQLSTSRRVREDYFGRGSDNGTFFFIPIGVPNGTGPNQGRFGYLGRSTFRGPGYRNFDVSLMKDTAFGRRGGAEAATLQLRAEFFNIPNLVNFSLPGNIVRGSGFGIISRTAGPARQIQLSLKLIY